jgi:branched-chain amino acid transport system substrate-binding protein
MDDVRNCLTQLAPGEPRQPADQPTAQPLNARQALASLTQLKNIAQHQQKSGGARPLDMEEALPVRYCDWIARFGRRISRQSSTSPANAAASPVPNSTPVFRAACPATPPATSTSQPYASNPVCPKRPIPTKPPPRNQPVVKPRNPRQISNQEKVLIMKKKKSSLLASNLMSLAAATAFTVLATQGALAQKKYDTGASDTEIKIGNVEAYSGPASAYGVIGKTEEAYFKMINDQGGVNGRKINFISYDDGYSPPKTVEQVRKLIESDEVFLVFNALGTPTQTAVQKYQNSKKVPQLFLATGASKWNDPKDFPWTMGYQPSYRVEARIFAKYILKTKPNAKVAVFYANDDFGKDYVAGLKDVFGDKTSSILIAEESYETSEPSIDSHIVKLKGTGADVFVNIATPKFAAQAIKKMAELDWKPMHVMTDVSISIGAVMKPAGLDASEGVLSAGYLKDASDPQWKDDAGMKKFMAFVDKYMPGSNISDANMVYGYSAAQTMVQVLKQSGDNLTRDNVMKQAASLKDFAPDTLLPGIKLNTSATDYAPVEQLQMMQFKGGQWELFGDIISAETGR